MAAPVGRRPRGPHDDAVDAYRRQCGRRLARARFLAGLSTYQLASRAGIPDASLVTRYETEGVLPSVARQFALAAALGVAPDVLWSFRRNELDDPGPAPCDVSCRCACHAAAEVA